MKKLIVMGLAAVSPMFGGIINISTGTGNANWQVSGPGVSGTIAAASISVAQENLQWAPAPASIAAQGSFWISWASDQGMSCVVGQTPGNNCANTVFNSSTGDTWVYTLVLPAATLGATSGTVNFIFGADNAVTSLTVGNNFTPLVWNNGDSAFDPLGCSAASPTSAGDTPATYANCVSTVSFSAANLAGDGSLTITADVLNSIIPGCLACGDPTGFVLEGTIVTGASTTPEPATFALAGAAVFCVFVFKRRLLRA